MLLSLKSFAGEEHRQAINGAIDAIESTDTVINAKRKLSNLGKKQIKKVPMGKEIGAIFGLALQPTIDFELIRNNKISLDYRNSQISYQFEYKF